MMIHDQTLLMISSDMREFYVEFVDWRQMKVYRDMFTRPDGYKLNKKMQLYEGPFHLKNIHSTVFQRLLLWLENHRDDDIYETGEIVEPRNYDFRYFPSDPVDRTTLVLAAQTLGLERFLEVEKRA
uniref:AraC family transcriptional regulator n=1 Tax=Rhabditophanes sp. KR3021 TaxID=114890 RepID=A0AC35TXE0_9BILA